MVVLPLLLRGGVCVCALLLLLATSASAFDGSGSGSGDGECATACNPCEDCIDGVCVLSNSTKKCANATGPCENDAFCTGSSGTCPTKVLKSGSLCRVSTMPCDVDDFCDGLVPACVDKKKLAGETCQANSTNCEATAYCTGASDSCPSNTLIANGTVCGSACNVQYKCTGVNNVCPSSPVPCSNKGACVSSTQTCNCNAGFGGSDCSQCVAGFYGASCLACPGGGNCSSHGTCSDGKSGTGVCTCTPGWTSSTCAARMFYSLAASNPVNGSSNITVVVRDSLGGYPSVSTSVMMVVDDSNLYRANATSGSQKINITNGVGVLVLKSQISGTVFISTVDFAGLNIIDAVTNVTFPVLAKTADAPPPGGAYVTGTVSMTGIPCSAFNTSLLSAFVSALATALKVDPSTLTVLQAKCGTGGALFRRTTSSTINVDVRVGLPSESSVGATSALFTTVTTPASNGVSPFAASLASNPVVNAVLVASGSTLATTPATIQLAISGVNCSSDSWSSWSSCVFQKCGGGQGVSTRFRRCPATSETQLCNAPACVDCSVNNGGCSVNATCGAKADGTALCTCAPTHVGDGYTCTVRTNAQQLSLVAQISYPVSLSLIAPTLIDQLNLQSLLIGTVAVAGSISLERFAFFQLVPTTTGFDFVFSVAPPLTQSDPTAVAIQTQLQTAIAAGKLNITSSKSPNPIAPSSAASTSGTSFYPSSGGNPSSDSSSSSWTVMQTLYVVIAVAGFMGIVAVSLLVVIKRRSSTSSVASKGPVWLPPAAPRKTSTSTSRLNSTAVAPITSSSALVSRATLSTPVPPALAGADTKRPSATTAWEADAIENELPAIPAVRHYYPGWDSRGSGVGLGSPVSSPVVSSPWI